MAQTSNAVDGNFVHDADRRAQMARAWCPIACLFVKLGMQGREEREKKPKRAMGATAFYVLCNNQDWSTLSRYSSTFKK